MKLFSVSLLVIAAVAPAQETQTFVGTINDDICARDGHARMRMGPTDAECTTLCVMLHNAAYVLDDGKNVYVLSDQRTPEKFAAQKVRITGMLDASSNTIEVRSIEAAR
jgi:hypothetical protein